MTRLVALLALLLLREPAVAAEFIIANQDLPGAGFNDVTPRDPVGGNSGTTLGEQRRIAFEHAAALWGTLLDSDVPIVVDASFEKLSCTAASAALGFAGSASSFADFEGAPRPRTLYPSALADALAGIDLDPGVRDILAKFNRDIDNGCFRNGASKGWYYGLDGKPGEGQIDFAKILMHELAHGLGFGTSVDLDSGRRCCGDAPEEQYDDALMLWLEDHTVALTWPEMTDAQRQASARRSGELHWVGPAVRAASSFLLQGREGDHVEMYAPSSIEGASSVSHFSISLFPNELLEPFFNATSMHLLATALLQDLGWPMAAAPTTATATATATSAVPTPSPPSSKTPAATATPTPSPCDGALSAADLTAIARAAAGEPGRCVGHDRNSDGKIDEADITAAIHLLFLRL
ncbi:MAG TPA: hypothetical protein VEB21_16990 [Terriglobales bacterium]|nr:hypothetical protein [Terriglobales bacterium]